MRHFIEPDEIVRCLFRKGYSVDPIFPSFLIGRDATNVTVKIDLEDEVRRRLLIV